MKPSLTSTFLLSCPFSAIILPINMPSVFHFFYLTFHQFLAILPVYISSHIYALLFAINLSLELPISPPLKSTATSVLSLPTTIISNPVPVENRRTIILFHGFSSSGMNDPRLVSFAHALVAAHPSNFVIIPEIRAFKACDLSENTIPLLRRIILAVAANKTLCPSGYVSLTSPCISGGFALAAAANVPVVHSILTIGAHASFESALYFLMNSDRDGLSLYSSSIMLNSFWNPPNPSLSHLLTAYCTDEHLKNIGCESNLLSAALENYPDEAVLFNRLHTDIPFLKHHLMRLYTSFKAHFAALSPISTMPQLQCDVTLLHASEDDIVPPSECFLLKEALIRRPRGKLSYMVTSLLNHGDQKALTFADLPEIFQVIHVFSTFVIPPKPSVSSPS